MLDGWRSATPPSTQAGSGFAGPTWQMLRAAAGRLRRARPSGESERSERTNEGEMALTTIDSAGGSTARSVTAGLTKHGIDIRGKIIEGLLIASLATSLVILAVLIGDMVQR